jgi:outer membrane receptor protein involved in Fe transport
MCGVGRWEERARASTALWVALLVGFGWPSVAYAQSQSAVAALDLAGAMSYRDVALASNEDAGDATDATDAADAGEAADKEPDGDVDKLLSMDLEQLADLDVVESSVTVPTGTLTATTTKTVSPSTVTRITREMIQYSGARNLDELLDIFVPNLQVIRHTAHYSHVGIRGTISDREDKYLLRVNGRTMNQRFLVGADSERDLPMLRDIDHVDVIRGPGSTTYGPGAIAGVISITTLNGTTFEGLDVNVRQGFEQYMTTTEMRWGKSLGEDSGIFMYYGYGDQPGADADASPLIYGRSGALPNAYPPNVAGEPAPFIYPNDEMGLGPKHKLHFQFTKDTFEFWTRYTKGSYVHDNTTRNMFLSPYGTAAPGSILENRPGQTGDYQQLTLFGSKVFEVSDDFQVTTILSYDFYDYVESRYNASYSWYPAREEEVYFRVMGRYTPTDEQAIAIGYEHSRETFGLKTPLSWRPTRGQRTGFITDPWHTDLRSLFGEYRIELADPLTLILSGRLDRHTYSKDLFSPRVSVMYEWTEEDLVKFNIGQSVRKQGDDELRAEWVANHSIAEEEVMRNIELRWERRPCEHWMFGTSVFYQHHNVVGFTGSLSRSTLLGTFESWGCEVEANYIRKNSYVTMSHGYVKLLNGSLIDPTLIQGISAEPYGFGDDFANWSNNLTKIATARDLGNGSNVSSSLRAYWGFPGAEDLADYNETLAPNYSGSIAQADPGYEKAWGPNLYLDFGYQQRWTEHISWRVDLYNVLGWCDIDLNKRNYINRLDTYRPEAAAVGLSGTVSF